MNDYLIYLNIIVVIISQLLNYTNILSFTAFSILVVKTALLWHRICYIAIVVPLESRAE